MKRLACLAFGLMTLGAQCLAAEPGWSKQEWETIMTRLDSPLILECGKYYEFGPFMEILLMGGIAKEKGSLENSKGLSQFLEYVKTYQLTVRQPGAPEKLAVQCHAIAQGVTEPLLLKAQLLSVLSLGKGLDQLLTPKK